MPLIGAESIGDSQIGVILIQAAGWAGGRHGWSDRILWTCGPGWFGGLKAAEHGSGGCRDVRESASPAWCSGRSGRAADGQRRGQADGQPPSAVAGRASGEWLLARLAGSRTRPCARWWRTDARAVKRRAMARSGGLPARRRRQLQKKALVASEQDRPDVAAESGAVEGVSRPSSILASGLHRRDLGQDQHDAQPRLRTARQQASSRRPLMVAGGRLPLSRPCAMTV